jgi:hypothetical protein
MQRSDRILIATVYLWIGNCEMVRFIAIGTMREQLGWVYGEKILLPMSGTSRYSAFASIFEEGLKLEGARGVA